MVSLMRHTPHLEQSETRRVEALVLLLALACLLVARVWPASSFKVMAMMPMQAQMAASADPVVEVDEVQSHHTCFDDALRCMGMLGGLCPLTQSSCALTSSTHLVAPQAQFPVSSVEAIWSSLWPAVPKQPPRH